MKLHYSYFFSYLGCWLARVELPSLQNLSTAAEFGFQLPLIYQHEIDVLCPLCTCRYLAFLYHQHSNVISHRTGKLKTEGDPPEKVIKQLLHQRTYAVSRWCLEIFFPVHFSVSVSVFLLKLAEVKRKCMGIWVNLLPVMNGTDLLLQEVNCSHLDPLTF